MTRLSARFHITFIFLFFCSVLHGQEGRVENSGSDRNVKRPFTSADQSKLEKFLSTEQVGKLNEFMVAWNKVKSPGDLADVFTKAQSIGIGLEDSLSSMVEKSEEYLPVIDWLDSIIPGISFSMYEGNNVIIKPRLSEFANLAKSTNGKSDDDFFEILLLSYGPYYLLPEWINQTWDYGGPSLLGNGLEVNILKKIQGAIASGSEFKPELVKIRKEILTDILEWQCYNFGASKVIDEIKKIMNSVPLTSDERNKLIERIDTMKNPPADLFIDCEHKECNCGG